MNQYKEFNIEDTRNIVCTCYNVINKKGCDTIYQVLTNGFGAQFSREGWKVAYGFISSKNSNVIVRHCFMLDGKNRIIDPAMAKRYPTTFTERDYYAFKLLKLQEYLRLLKENDRLPNMYNAFKEEEEEACHWARDHGFYPII